MNIFDIGQLYSGKDFVSKIKSSHYNLEYLYKCEILYLYFCFIFYVLVVQVVCGSAHVSLVCGIQRKTCENLPFISITSGSGNKFRSSDLTASNLFN